MTTTTAPRSTALPITRAARLLGVHPNTLRAWADQGRVRCLRVNARGDRRFLVEDLHSFVLAAQATPGTISSLTEDLSPLGPPPAATDWEAQIDSIAKLGTRLNHLSTVAEIGTAICFELRQLIDYHNVRVYRVSGDDVLPVAWHGEIGEYTDEDGSQLHVRVGEGITGWVARHGVAQYLPDAAHDPRGVIMPGTDGGLDESMLVAPMIWEDRTIGVIVLSKMGLDRFAPHDLRYLGIYAAIAAQAMVNADSSERMRAQQETLDQQLHSQRELLRVTEAILTNLDPAAVIAEVADALGGLIPVDTLGVYVHEPRHRSLSPMLARGVGADVFMSRRLPDSGEVVSEVLGSGDARSVRRGGADPAAVIIAPLRGRDRVLGILHLKRLGRAARFEPREFDLVRLFAAHASIALQNALTHRAVEIRAQMDALTGLRNHGTFREELQTAVLGGQRFALLMLDLDDFKSYNDRHGHEAGNVLLKSIAEAIRRACRESDRVYRYGGDEFTLVLPRTGVADAVDVAERIRAAIRGLRGSGRRRAGMRCSVGVAAFPADASDRVNLLLAADRALYAAKRAGRDRICTAADGLALAAEFVPPSTPVDEPVLLAAT
ncbi:MAG TPA: diguanylate cyclase [Candidatus Limnocylindrales bacterium]|nr:diguanylate cyclase [Candidatus Limnocylindrales bacterium]